ncbi:MAG TPA: phosphoribosylanthranilate isomerase [Clostridia bacterium]|nr:phosphoribosylanthranilate isomerase [Clostridia bacterium]
MTRVMICGSIEESDVDLLVREGVDAIGLITEVSQDISCNLSRDRARALMTRIPPLVSGVLIVTEERRDEICRMVDYIRPHAVQLHGLGGPSPDNLGRFKGQLGVKVIRTVHLHRDNGLTANGDDPVAYAAEYASAGVDAILLDSFGGGKVGATGRTVDFEMAFRICEAIRPCPLILAGGLSPSNVSEAIEKVRPYGVDAFSSVTNGGRLDAWKIRSFIQAVRRSDAAIYGAYTQLEPGGAERGENSVVRHTRNKGEE